MKTKSLKTASLGATCLLAAGLAAAQSSPNTLVTGSWHETAPFGYDERGTFTCRGTPTCVGQFSVSVRLENCTNYGTFSGDFTATGMNLAQSGTFSGTVTETGPDLDAALVRKPDGTCEYPNPPSYTGSFNYTGTWNRDAGTGTITFVYADGSATGTFKADVEAPAPVFPMVVRSRIDAATATATADIQYRPQDVGTAGSVFVFAVAPSTIVKGALEKAVRVGPARMERKATPAASCVISQLSPAGQLVAVTAGQLQAYLSGTLSAQGASVSILDNVPTPAVAGATFYVGYGAGGAAMLDQGVFRNAVLVPGSSVCPTLPLQTALWWNPKESGWGLNLTHQGSTVFGTLFTYDANRAPLWLVMSGGVMQSDGVTFTGDLYRTTGPAFNAVPFTPIGPPNYTRVGAMTVSFTDANAGTLDYTVNGVAVHKNIQRLVYGSRAPTCLPAGIAGPASANYQELWWNEAESGWGLNVTHQDSTLFATLFTYDAGGRDLWLVMSGGLRQPDGSFQGDLYRTTGPPFNASPFTPIGAADYTKVGTMSLRFSGANQGTLSYSVDGANVTKAVTRIAFSDPQSCH